MSQFDVQQTVPPSRPQKGWFGRNWWWVLLLVLVGGGVACAGICTGVVYFGIKVMKDSEPYQLTLQAVRSDPTVVERLGEPIQDDWQVSVQVVASGNRATARVDVPVSGPKGTAEVSSESQMINGKWGLTSVEVTFSNGDRHALDIKADQAGEGASEAPKWPPGERGADQMPPEANP
ncbi:MAG TPA: cytochrome c oxidase assembly factor Coa1 family protein [Thermoguttaceae bacterium]|nr:cytochrome c oxidase assembly factor Coa1 family protein [Thermoguttaceae bacterium]